MGNEVFLGCDIGTGSCKMLAYQADGTVIKEVHSFYDVRHPAPGYSEQEPQIIKKAFIECANKLMDSLEAKPVALGFSSCMHSLILVDGRDQLLSPMITWEDNRSAEIAKRLRASAEGEALYLATGTPIHSMSPLCKIRWYFENEKETFAKTARFIGIKEYLWKWMFGVYEVDESIASATGLFNIHSRQLDPNALNYCHISAKHLSELKDTTFSRKNASQDFHTQTKFPGDMRFCVGASDGCMANAGSRIDSNEKAAVTIGTSGAVRITSSTPVADYGSMIFNYVLDANHFVSGGPVNNGGNILRWMFKELLGINDPAPHDYSAFESSISLIPAGSEGLVCVPWLFGERAPVWDEKAAGIWFGVSEHHTKFHLIRAAMEGVCYTLRMILEKIEGVSGPIRELYISGGFIHSAEWVQMLANITQKKVVINELSDASSIGAAIWAMKACGVQTVRIMEKEKSIMPVPDDTEVLTHQYKIFSRLYGLTKEEMHLLKG